MTKWDGKPLTEPPTRLCCGKKHWGVLCPDGKVMCQICFHRFDVADLWRDREGVWDVCKTCGEHEEQIRKMGRGMG